MEWDLRWILLGVGALIFCVVAVQGLRHTRRRYKNRIRFDLEQVPDYAPGELERDKNGFDRDGVSTPRATQRVTPTINSAAPAEASPVATEQAPPKHAEVTQNQPTPQRVIVLNVFSKTDHGFAGGELLQTLLGLGLRYGEMNIFHRHEQDNGQGNVLFSVAKAVKPGTFDLHAMTDSRVPGITLFMTAPSNQIGQDCFELMLSTAQKIAERHDGHLLTDTREPLKADKISNIRASLRGDASVPA